jgi:hypothetical protein
MIQILDQILDHHDPDFMGNSPCYSKLVYNCIIIFEKVLQEL